jgi:hypothetical protein
LNFKREGRIWIRHDFARVDQKTNFLHGMTQNTRSLYEENSRNRKMFGVYSQWYLVCLLTEVSLRNTQLQLPVVLCSSRGDVSHSRCFVKVEMPPNCSAVNCKSKRSDKSISFHIRFLVTLCDWLYGLNIVCLDSNLQNILCYAHFILISL